MQHANTTTITIFTAFVVTRATSLAEWINKRTACNVKGNVINLSGIKGSVARQESIPS